MGAFLHLYKVCDHHMHFFTELIAPSSTYYCLLFLRQILPAPQWPRTFFSSVNQCAPKHGVEQVKKIIPPKIAPS